MVETRVEPTCTEAGHQGLDCINCDYTKANVIPATGHSYEDGVCTVCGEADPDYNTGYDTGDVNGDGFINATDLFYMKLIIFSSYTPTQLEYDAADITGEGTINGTDLFYLKLIIYRNYTPA